MDLDFPTIVISFLVTYVLLDIVLLNFVFGDNWLKRKYRKWRDGEIQVVVYNTNNRKQLMILDLYFWADLNRFSVSCMGTDHFIPSELYFAMKWEFNGNGYQFYSLSEDTFNTLCVLIDIDPNNIPEKMFENRNILLIEPYYDDENRPYLPTTRNRSIENSGIEWFDEDEPDDFPDDFEEEDELKELVLDDEDEEIDFILVDEEDDLELDDEFAKLRPKTVDYLQMMVSDDVLEGIKNLGDDTEMIDMVTGILSPANSDETLQFLVVDDVAEGDKPKIVRMPINGEKTDDRGSKLTTSDATVVEGRDDLIRKRHIKYKIL